MTDVVRSILNEIADAASSGVLESDPERIGRMLDAVMETVADILPSSSGERLCEGALAASCALSRVMMASNAPIDRESPDFIAGRLAAIIDILGYASAKTTDDADVGKALEKPYACVIAALATGLLRDADLDGVADLSEEAMSTTLAELRAMGMLTKVMHGRDVYNALTPVGMILAEEIAAARQSAAPQA